jgi:hypothetical protein
MITRVLILLFFFSHDLSAQKPRLIVTTDIGQDPDDEQSMVRLLHYANEFDIEGIIANADSNYKNEAPVLKDSIIHNMIDAYSKIENNLRKHDHAYPTSEILHRVVKRGCYGNAENIPFNEYIGPDKDTEGSEWLIHVVDKRDDRPVNIAVWGGACDLAQALWKIKSTRSETEVKDFVQKLRVFFIGKQDSSNDWIINQFPSLWLILALDMGGDIWQSSYRGMFWGGDMNTTSREWLHKNIIDLNPLAQMYPDKAYTGGENKNPHMAMKEGDSPSLLYFLSNGLNSPGNPSWGGWGGRYTVVRDQFYRDASDTYFDEQSGKEIQSQRATVFRWRRDFQNDFAARAKWAVSNYEDANHPPSVSVNENAGNDPIFIRTKPGKSIKLDASESTDPDGDVLTYQWMLYPEAGTYEVTLNIVDADKKITTLVIPGDGKGKTLHVILCLSDNAELTLTSYKRIVIEIE